MAFESGETWREYCDIFRDLWGLTPGECNDAGLLGKKIFAAEYNALGPSCYMTSVMLPIRNARYACEMLDGRWRFLKSMRLQGSILDYGCGAGVLLAYLSRLGYEDLYGHELPGVQHTVMERVFANHNIKVWADEPVDTVLCFNVLEHVEDPVGLLNHLQSVGKRVIANVCMDDDDSTCHRSEHIASKEELEECRNILKISGGLYEVSGTIV